MEQVLNHQLVLEQVEAVLLIQVETDLQDLLQVQQVMVVQTLVVVAAVEATITEMVVQAALV